MNQISRSEWIWLAWVVLALLLMGSIPYVYAHWTTPPGEHFMGVVSRGTTSANEYFMLIRQARDGNYLFVNQLTPEPTPRAYFSLEWLALGWAAKWMNVSLNTLFQIERVVTLILFAGAIYWFISLCIANTLSRKTVLLYYLICSGFGYLLLIVNRLSGKGFPFTYDIQSISIFSFAISKPHLLRGLLCAVLQYGCLIAGERTGKYRYFVYSGLASMAHSIIRPYHIPETFLLYIIIPSILCALERGNIKRRVMQYGTSFLIALPYSTYIILATMMNVMGMSNWVRQSPQYLHQIIWLGIPYMYVSVYFFMFGMSRISKASSTAIILGLWLFLEWILYNATPYYVVGNEQSAAFILAPPVLLFMGGLPHLLSWLRQHMPRINLDFSSPLKQRMLAGAFIIIALPSNGYSYYRHFYNIHSPLSPNLCYLRDDAYKAMSWLNENSMPNEVVLSSLEMAQFIVRITNCKVMSGQEMLTADYVHKNEAIRRFYSCNGDEEFKRTLIKQFSIKYIYTSSYERKYGDFNPEKYRWLKKIYQRDDVSIYRVILPRK